MGKLLERWRYGSGDEAGSRRDLRLDLLRGWCVVVMVVDHIGGRDSWLYAITGGNRFFVSAAEGFVLISGITMGIVYARVIAREGIRAAVEKVLRRVQLLYALTVALTLVFAALSALLRSPWAREAAPGEPPEFLIGVVTLHRSYSLTDVLLLYTLLVLAAAPVLALFARGRTAHALAVSWTLWALWQVAPATAQLPWTIVDEGFPFPAWQVIFVTGLAIGYHRGAVARRIAGLRALSIAAATTVASGAVVLAYVAGIVVPPSLHGEGTLGTVGQILFDKDDAAIGRLAVLTLVSIASYAVVTYVWRPIALVAGRALLPLGQRALVAYSIHLFIVAASATALAEPLRRAGGNAAVQLAGIAIVAVVLALVADAASTLPRLRAIRPHLPIARPVAVSLAALLFVSACVPGAVPPAASPTSEPVSSAQPAGSATPSPSAAPIPLAEVQRELSESRVVSRRFRSELLGREMPYYVFVPPGYDDARDARYPVLYMLHGMGGSNIEWLGYGLARTAERLMRTGEIPPLLIVLPQGDQSYWMDHAGGGPKWGSYVAREVVAEVDARYRTLADRRYRGVGGLSMGADGALQIALNHPDVFGVAGAHSPYLRRESEALRFFGGGADYAERDPWSLALTRPEVARTLSLWIDVGDADERRSAVVGFHRDLEDAGIQHAWREYIGSHSEEYWGGYAPHYLRYYAAMFCGVEDDPRQHRIDIGASCPPYPSQRR